VRGGGPPARDGELLTRDGELLTRNGELLTRNGELLTRNGELLAGTFSRHGVQSTFRYCVSCRDCRDCETGDRDMQLTGVAGPERRRNPRGRAAGEVPYQRGMVPVVLLVFRKRGGGIWRWR
jgi:hypothetical protein